MKYLKGWNIILLGICSLLAQPIFAQEKNNDQTLSPYFFVKSEDDSIDKMPLLHTEANVNIAGVIADVKVTQLYKNEGKKSIEAIYIFPASTRAAVYDMRMTIGERTIVAKIEEKGKARADYEQAKSEGKSASLLEQERPNVFQMNVANIMPGDKIKVELSYTELIVPEDGLYEFVYPTVVGPRYSNTPKTDALASNEDWVENPYLHEGEAAPYTFDMKINIQAAVPIQSAVSTSHKVNINYTSKDHANIELNASDKSKGNKDFIVQYVLKGKEIENGMLLYEGEKENFFMMMMQPPERIIPKEMPTREYIFIVDISGSMNGFPLDISKKMMKELLGTLQSRDKFNVLTFAGSANFLSEQSVTATPTNIQQAMSTLQRKRGGGSTELLPALKKAMSAPKPENTSRSFVILTDGYVTVESDAFDYIKSNLGNANFFSFGIGSSVNRHLIEGMARVGYGEPFIVTKQEEGIETAARFKTYIQSPVLTNIKTDFSGLEVYDVYPKEVPDLLGERPLIIYGKYKNRPTGKITVKGESGKGKFKESIDVSTVKASKENQALRYIWARQRIKSLDDYSNLSRNGIDDKLIDEVTDLGLKYNLLTKYTSFIAIDSKVRNKDGKVETVKQPLPMPEGVSDAAVGGNRGAIAYSTTSNYKSSLPRTYSPKPKFKPVPIVPSTTVTEQTVEEEKEEEVYAIVEQMPLFVGSQGNTYAEKKRHSDKLLLEFIIKNIQYPQDAREQGIEGIVVVSFVIDKQGNVRDIKLIRSVSPSCDKEALRVIGLMPKWIPGRQRGKNVNVQYNFPFNFKLPSK